MRDIEHDLIARHAAPVPRYTSYPTAPNFAASVGADDYVALLEGVRDTSSLSLYLHIPYCHELCWYCGCNTKAVKRYEPVARYVATLEREIGMVAAHMTGPRKVTSIHWGGGSPNVLSAAHIRSLADRVRARFEIAGGAEIAVEIDPRTLSVPQVHAFTDTGVNRVSFGVQDFDPAVQAAINRMQPFDMTRRAVDLFRDRGVAAINLDLVYGLPHQTLATAERTLHQVLRLSPDRIAAFGYAHLPSRLKHQRLIETRTLAGPVERFQLSKLIAQTLTGAGYVQIGLDHFAQPSDPLASRQVVRNFQGYTTDQATGLIGPGASAIGRIGDTYFQNATPAGEYIACIDAGRLATARGLKLDAEDRLRGFVIERLMCDLQFPGQELNSLFGAAAEPVRREAQALLAGDSDGLVERAPGGFRVTDRGRPFIRSLCARFDSYLQPGTSRHAIGV